MTGEQTPDWVIGYESITVDDPAFRVTMLPHHSEPTQYRRADGGQWARAALARLRSARSVEEWPRPTLESWERLSQVRRDLGLEPSWETAINERVHADEELMAQRRAAEARATEVDMEIDGIELRERARFWARQEASEKLAERPVHWSWLHGPEAS